MIVRFCLYGFLKNLRLFEAFFILALYDRGLDFLAIGLLIAVREVTINLLEVPSGALADGLGRKRCLSYSMAAYVLSYVLLAWAQDWWLLALAMLFFGFGDAFRSGTHKSIIFTWLQSQGMEGERTRVYGYTRSWSKLGSAVSALVAGLILLSGLDYQWIFIVSIVPALLNFINVSTYPASLSNQTADGVWSQIKDSLRHVLLAAKDLVHNRALRALLLGTMAMEGAFAVCKDYLQPLMELVATSIPFALSLAEQQRTGLIIGLTAAVTFYAASLASKHAHKFERLFKEVQQAECVLIICMLLLYVVLAFGVCFDIPVIALIVFMLMTLCLNLWRPIHISRFDSVVEESRSTTVLSIESQAKAICTAVLAPGVGALMDHSVHVTSGDTSMAAMWPILVLGVPVLLLFLVQIVAKMRR